MKVKFLLFLIFFVFGFSFCAYADEPTYLVKIDDGISLLSDDYKPDIRVVDKEGLQKLQAEGIVEYYEENQIVELYNDGWNVEAMNASFPWEIGCFGNDVRVAVIDSGLSIVGDIGSNMLEGHNFLDDSSDVNDTVGHGTFVSGLIASKEYGFAYKSKIIPLKCFDSGVTTYTSTIVLAIYSAVNDYDCDVINLSLGVESYSQALDQAVNYASSRGVIVVAAVGNNGTTNINYPAGCENSIGVGSVARSKTVSTFSQKNESVFVVAPGENMQSLRITGYTASRGTSFAAPEISALAAIAKCIDSEITIDEFKEVVKNNAVDLGTVGYDTSYGYGLVNFKGTVRDLISGNTLFISPVSHDTDENVVYIYNNTNDVVNFKGIFASYNNNTLVESKISDLSVGGKKAITFSNADSGSLVKFMAWNSLVEQTPLADFSEYRLN